MNRRKSGILIIAAALTTGGIVNLRDLFKGQAFHFGTAQLIASLVCLLFAGMGVLLAFTRIPLPSLPRPDWLHPVRWLERSLNHLADFFARGKRPQIADALIITGFAIFSLLYTLGRWNGVIPFIYVGSDASYISSYAAALDHPGQFAADYFLSNQAHVSSYFALHIPLIRGLSRLTGSYGGAFLMLLPLAIFFKLLGFYLVGKRLLNSRGLALLLAVVTFPVVLTGAWDNWGLIGDALPRNLFDIAFPWLIYWSVAWIARPKRWYLLALLLGLLVYVHSISAGTTFAVLTLVYLVLSPAPFGKRLGQTALSALIFASAAAPFAIVYATSFSSAATVPLPYADSLAILLSVYGANHFNVLQIAGDLVVTLTRSGILPLALVAPLAALLMRKNLRSSAARTLAVWILGLVLVSIVGPYAERLLDPWLNMVSVQMMLVRGLRYLPPLLLLFAFLAFFDGERKIQLRFPALSAGAAVLLVAACLGLNITANQQDPYVGREVACLASGHLVCPTDAEKDAVDILAALDEYTTPDDTVLTVPPLNVTFSNAIRYQALRPMGYSKQDVTRMNDDPAQQQAISAAMKPWNALEHADEATRLQAYIDLAGEMHADYLIVQLSDFKKKALQGLEPVYSNDTYALVKIPD